MSEERLVVWVEAEEEFDVKRFSVFEAMSRPFEVMLVLRSPNVAIDFDKIVNRPASFRVTSGLQNATEPKRLWTGFCNHLEQLRPEPEEGGTMGRSTYLLHIVPKLWQLHLGADNRIFRHMSVPDIVKEVLSDWEITPDWRVNDADYKKLEYIVQYDESDFAFCSRLLERAGISYFFEHEGDKPTKLVLIDEPHRGKVREGLEWVDAPSEAAQAEYCTNVRIAHKVKPGKVTMRDYDFHQKADFALLGESEPAKGAEAAYEHYSYTPGLFRVKNEGSDELADEKGAWPFRHTPDEAKVRAQRKLWTLRRGKRTVCFDTNVIGFHPGRLMSMDGHPREDLAKDKSLLITEYQLDGEPNDKWLFSAEAVFTDLAYQPAHKTPKPIIAGVQSAIVVGPGSGDYGEIYPDEHGRVKAQFHWDRAGKFDDKSSCWMRVSQAWAGSRFGTVFLPRVKNEVLVSYFEGDPDLPVIIGRAYNVTRPVPYKLPDHLTKSLWKTKTSPESKKANAYNELRFEDGKDAELFYLQAQKDYQELVKRSETERTGSTRVTVVGNHRTSVVAKVDAHLVGEKYSIQIMEEPDKGKDDVEDKKQLEILGQLKPDLTPLPTKVEMIDKRIMSTSGEATVVMDDKEITFNAKGELSLKADGNIVIFGGSDIKINC